MICDALGCCLMSFSCRLLYPTAIKIPFSKLSSGMCPSLRCRGVFGSHQAVLKKFHSTQLAHNKKYQIHRQLAFCPRKATLSFNVQPSDINRFPFSLCPFSDQKEIFSPSWPDTYLKALLGAPPDTATQEDVMWLPSGK